MARLGEPFQLGTFHGTIVGVSQCKLELQNTFVSANDKNQMKNLSDDLVVVTIQGNGIHVYNANDQKCIKSWFVKPGFTFTQEAIQNPKNQKFYVIEKKQKIHCWDVNTEFEKGISKQISRKLFAIKISNLFENLIVICADGLVGTMDSNLNHQPSFVTPKDAEGKQIKNNILYATSIEREKSVDIITFGKGDGKLILNIFKIGQGVKDCIHMASYYISENTEFYPVSCCFDEDQNQFVLCWSNYSWEQYQLPSFEKNIKGETLHSIKSISLSGYEQAPKKEDSVELFERAGFSSAIISPSFLALVGTKGESNVVTVWDLKYGTVQADQSFERSTYQSENLFDNFKFNVYCMSSSSEKQGYLVVTELRSVWIFSIDAHPLSLLDLIGKMKETKKYFDSSSSQKFVSPPAFGIVQAPNGKGNWKESFEAQQKKEKDIIEQLTNPKKTPDIESFQKIFFEYTKNGSPSKVNISHHLALNILDRCLIDPNFFPVEVLDYLITSNSLSGSDSKLLLELISRNELDLIESILVHTQDLSEPGLVKLLRYILSIAPHELLKNFVHKKRTQSAKALLFQGDQPRDFFLYLIVSAPRNDLFLQANIKSLTFLEVSTVLTFLINLLDKYSESTEDKLQKAVATRIPSFAQLLDWIGVILDAHFGVLVMTKEGHPLLKQLEEIIKQQLEFCDKFEGLLGVLEHFLSSASVPTKKISSYQIEMFRP